MDNRHWVKIQHCLPQETCKNLTENRIYPLVRTQFIASIDPFPRCRNCSRVRAKQGSDGGRGRGKQFLVLVIAMCATLTTVPNGNNLRKERFVLASEGIAHHGGKVIVSLWLRREYWRLFPSHGSRKQNFRYRAGLLYQRPASSAAFFHQPGPTS